MLTDLKKSIRRPDSDALLEKEKVPVSILMNPIRQKILQFLFKFPCTHMHAIARNFEYSINTTRWHLRKLLEFGYISDYNFGNRRIFYPSNSLPEEDIQILGLLNNKRYEIIYLEIKQNPGITQKELYENLNKKQSTILDNLIILESNALIYSQRDGLYRRYYLSDLIETRELKIKKAFKDYRRVLIQLLKKDGVEPEILRTTDKKFHVRIKSGKFLADLIFFFNPYERFVE